MTTLYIFICSVQKESSGELKALHDYLCGDPLMRWRDKTHAVKQGMMQQFLTGRVRLVELEVIMKQMSMNDPTLTPKCNEEEHGNRFLQ